MSLPDSLPEEMKSSLRVVDTFQRVSSSETGNEISGSDDTAASMVPLDGSLRRPPVKILNDFYSPFDNSLCRASGRPNK